MKFRLSMSLFYSLLAVIELGFIVADHSAGRTVHAFDWLFLIIVSFMACASWSRFATHWEEHRQERKLNQRWNFTERGMDVFPMAPAQGSACPPSAGDDFQD